eukprot:GEZU01004825.1.p1 GENE.GEZU01004825.1~~GEZU01004825.1.p1  ORF type:complete len:102 (-),score=19.08 GEZU01004825.1:43-348(-)
MNDQPPPRTTTDTAADDATTETKENISIKVANSEGHETIFRIKRSTPMGKLMDAYCKRQGLNMNSVRFNFDGVRIAPAQTARELGLEEEDVIDAMVEQIGG